MYLYSVFLLYRFKPALSGKSRFNLEMRTGRAGPGRAGLNFLGPRAERAENGPKPSQERNKVYIKNQKFL